MLRGEGSERSLVGTPFPTSMAPNPRRWCTAYPVHLGVVSAAERRDERDAERLSDAGVRAEGLPGRVQGGR